MSHGKLVSAVRFGVSGRWWEHVAVSFAKRSCWVLLSLMLAYACMPACLAPCRSYLRHILLSVGCCCGNNNYSRSCPYMTRPFYHVTNNRFGFLLPLASLRLCCRALAPAQAALTAAQSPRLQQHQVLGPALRAEAVIVVSSNPPALQLHLTLGATEVSAALRC